MNELVEKLSTGKHPVAAERCKDTKELQEMLERRYVLIKFTGTRGGTELGFQIDEARSSLEADFETPAGSIHLEGELELNYEPVRMVVDIDVKTLKGEGHLEIREKETAEVA